VVEFVTNTFTCKMRSLSVEINEKHIQYNFRTYMRSKLEYYFREGSLNHNSLFVRNCLGMKLCFFCAAFVTNMES